MGGLYAPNFSAWTLFCLYNFGFKMIHFVSKNYICTDYRKILCNEINNSY